MSPLFPQLTPEHEQDLLYIENLTAINERLTAKNKELQHATDFHARCADILGFLLMIAIFAIGYLLFVGVSHV